MVERPQRDNSETRITSIFRDCASAITLFLCRRLSFAPDSVSRNVSST